MDFGSVEIRKEILSLTADSMEMSKELILLYFRNKSTYQEDKVVEDWLNSMC